MRGTKSNRVIETLKLSDDETMAYIKIRGRSFVIEAGVLEVERINGHIRSILFDRLIHEETDSEFKIEDNIIGSMVQVKGCVCTELTRELTLQQLQTVDSNNQIALAF